MILNLQRIFYGGRYMKPKISVVTPCYNCEKYLLDTLNSVFRQTVLPNEIVLVDDGSTDSTVDLIEKIIVEHSEINIRLIKQKNSGPGAARNAGIQASKGDWIAFLDSDDIWREKKIEKVLEAIVENPEAIMIANDICEVYEDGRRRDIFLHTYYNSNESGFVQLYHGCFLSTSSVCVKKEILEKVDGFDNTLRSAQDYDLWLRVSQEGKIVFIPEIFEEYRIRSGSVSGNVMLRYQCLLRICRKYADSLLEYMDKKQAKKYILRQVAAAHVGCVKGLKSQRQYIKILWLLIKMMLESINVLTGGYQ